MSIQAKVADLHDQGLSKAEIAKRLCTTEDYIRACLQRTGRAKGYPQHRENQILKRLQSIDAERRRLEAELHIIQRMKPS